MMKLKIIRGIIFIFKLLYKLATENKNLILVSNGLIEKLINKGFSSKTNGTNEYFVGEFNGVDVNVYIATNNNKVFRIMLCDAQTLDEADIKVRFNKLVSQFERNQRYQRRRYIISTFNFRRKYQRLQRYI